jgi:hypothetical protein
MKMKPGLLVFIVFILLSSNAFSKDKNFYIFLCFGQSNMEGNARIEPQDTTVDNSCWLKISCQPNPGGHTLPSCWYTNW